MQDEENAGDRPGRSLVEPKAEDPLWPFLFEDVTERSGVNYTYRNGEEANQLTPLEAVGGGVALLDYDGDGLLDIFFTGGGYFASANQEGIKGHPHRLYKNLGNFRFRDVTREAGLDKPLFYSHGVTVGDIDNDGWPDLLVTGYGRVALYHNVAGPDGKRRFVDVTQEAGLGDVRFWSTGAAFGDLDGDGFPDLYICGVADWTWQNHKTNSYFQRRLQEWRHDIEYPKYFPGVSHAIFRNDGRGGFENWTDKAGINFKDLCAEEMGRGSGVVLADLDGDHRPEIIVANSSPNNFCFFNLSTPGRLLLAARPREQWVGPTGPRRQGSKGVDIGDPWETGLPAILFTGEDITLHRNSVMRKPKRTVSFPKYLVSNYSSSEGWGTAMVDWNNKGHQDLVVANGSYGRRTFAPETVPQPPMIFLGKGNGPFGVATGNPGGYFAQRHRGRGLAVGDLDKDGFPDLVITHLNEPVVILRNKGSSFGNHWVGVELRGTANRNLVGSKLVLKNGDRRLTRFVRGGGGYLSSGDPRFVFGLGKTPGPLELWVEWATGEPSLECYRDLHLDEYQSVVQGKGKQGTRKEATK
jgi:hypothetical protein